MTRSIIAVVVIISFLTVSCAARQPYRTPAKDEIKRLETAQEEPKTLSDWVKEPKEPRKRSQWFGPTEKAILTILFLGIVIAAGFYGMKKQLDDADWNFDWNAILQ
jgi:hypothetical protein